MPRAARTIVRSGVTGSSEWSTSIAPATPTVRGVNRTVRWRAAPGGTIADAGSTEKAESVVVVAESVSERRLSCSSPVADAPGSPMKS